MDTGDSVMNMDNAAQIQLSSASVREPVRLIAEQLLSRIEAGEYRTRLPAERLLAEEFGVPRNTIRGALDLLEESKVIRRHAGSGNFICKSAAGANSRGAGRFSQNALVAENTGPHKLQTVRGIFEPELVRQAVIHASPKSIDALRKIVDRMELIRTDTEKFAQCEESFCVQLAHATENPLLIAVYQLITDVRRLSNWKAQRRKRLSPERIRECQARYRAMFEAIEWRDADSAVEYLRLLLVDEQPTGG
ncbi:MAG: FadR family transcriptional regulator [Hyphomicrobiales bacterium]|nr:FadR family transcriptional regulator [Hyphomicrobiales bacterium]